MDSAQTALTLRGKIIGTLLRDARQHAGKSVEECAQAIGIAKDTFEQYEMGEQAPSMPELEGLAYFLEAPLDHFWEQKTLTTPTVQKKIPNMESLIRVRQRMVGALVRQARLEAGQTLESLAHQARMDVIQLEAYELGEAPIPLPQLEVLSGMLNRSIREFQDRHGPVGLWTAQQRALQDFLAMPLELQTFVSKPVHRPYLELAIRLSEMSVDRLRGVAEGLLEITY